PRPNQTVATGDKHAPAPEKKEQLSPVTQDEPKLLVVAQPKSKPRVRPTVKSAVADQSDVWSSDLAYLDMDDRDTARHIEQSQNLLRSIKNVAIAEGDDEIDVTYDKALSRRLLNENIVLR